MFRRTILDPVTLATLGCLGAMCSASITYADCLEAKLFASDPGADDQFGRGLAASGDIVVVGATENGSGWVYVFSRNEGETNGWGQVTSFNASEPSADIFGSSVSVDGDTIVVGAALSDHLGNNSGSVYVYARNQGGPDNWGNVLRLNADDADDGDQFGFSVAVSGDIIIVGADRNDDAGSNSGSAYIFSRNQGGADNWGQLVKLTPKDGEANDIFGFSVSVDGDTAIVGALDSMENGSAYVFMRNEGGADNWGQLVKIAADDGDVVDQFGWQVSLSGNLAIVSAPNDDDGGESSGSAYVFARNQDGADAWGQVTKLTAFDGEAFDFFGTSVSISGNSLIVGAWQDSDGGNAAGAAYLFSKDEGGADNWGFVDKLRAADATQGNYFGRAVAMHNSTAVVGAPHNDDQATWAGAAYIFNLLLDPCPADITGDGIVGIADLLALLASWGECN